MTYSESSGLWSVHSALDIGSNAGAPVRAIGSGQVIDCGEDDLSGTWLCIEHPNGYVSRYCSLQLLGAYQPGDTVNQGSVIGFVGNTHTDEKHLGPHLHLEILHNGTPIDPLRLLK